MQVATDDAAIRHIISQYARGVELADIDLAATIWSQKEDVSFIHPRGHERGWNAVRDNFYIKTMQELFSKREIVVQNVAISICGDFAWSEFYWYFSAKRRSDGAQVETKGRESQIYRREGTMWRIVHVHYSPMPAMAQQTESGKHSTTRAV